MALMETPGIEARSQLNVRCLRPTVDRRSRQTAAMDEAVARAIHVVAVVIWIGGVAFVTMIVLPILRARREPGGSMTVFRAVEKRFARLARGAVLFAGLSGLYLLNRLDLWNRFLSPRFWWMHAMVIMWLLFAT